MCIVLQKYSCQKSFFIIESTLLSVIEHYQLKSSEKIQVKADRRIQKTKKSLTEALIQLILAKGYEKVTIQDIIDKANVGRSTFYIHYENKEQLLFEGPNNLNVNMFEDSTATSIDFLALFNHIAENKQLAKAMLGKKASNLMREYFLNNTMSKIKKKYSDRFGKTKSERRILNYLSTASATAVMSALVSWLDDDLPYSPTEMSGLCQGIVEAVFAKSYWSLIR